MSHEGDDGMFLKKKKTCNIKSKLQVVEMCLNCA